ncbi:MAG: tetratricopeptide repeat protein [Spirochaetia bacterium]
MPIIILLIIILGAGVVLFTFFLVKMLISPKKNATLASYMKQNRTAAVIKIARQIIAKNPKNADAHYFLGLAYLSEGKEELALMELKTVNQIGDFSGYCNETAFRKKIADLFVKFNQGEEALKEYLLLLKKDPENPDYYFAAGKLFEERNRSAKAAAFYQKAIEKDHRHGESHFRLGLLLYRSKRPADARARFDEALKYNQDNYQPYYYIGKILKEAGDFSGAAYAFEKAQKDPEFKVRALVERGGAFMSMHSFERAITELERAIKLSENGTSPEHLFGRYFLSLCYEQTRQIEMAIEQWEYIYSKKPNFRDVSEKLSQYQELRHDDKMKDYLTMGQNEFMEMCKRMTRQLNLNVNDVSSIPEGCQIIGAEHQTKWRNARKMPKLVWFLRTADMVEEQTIRNMNDELKKWNVTRGIIITSSTFSRMAVEFAENRPIELLNRDRLQALLKQIDSAEG